MSAPYVRPDRAALDELETLIGHLGEEAAGWRRRSLKAEAELAAQRGAGSPALELGRARERILELETENQDLRRRVEAARERVQQLANRLAFLERGGAVGA